MTAGDDATRPTLGERVYASMGGHFGAGPIDYASLPIPDWRHLTPDQRSEWEDVAERTRQLLLDSALTMRVMSS